MKLQITLKVNGGNDSVGPIVTKTDWNVDMEDCSIFAWFKVFESVLGAAGFNETRIMRGACQLAFNDCRDQKVMKQLAADCKFTNWNDVND
jgi:hypothetical protein